jgi:hypothetical protein
MDEGLFIDDSEDFIYYSANYSTPQFLGRSGMTHPCVNAMATILTSTFQPEKITAVIGDFPDDTPHERVLFLVWEWLSPGITIVADGFGTHGGTGGDGLSIALGLIKFYQIPLQQVWVSDKKAFDELAHGTFTKAMFDHVRAAYDYHWNFYPLPTVSTVKRGTQTVLEVHRSDGHRIFEMRIR